MFAIHQVAISPGFTISSEEEAATIVKNAEQQNSAEGLTFGRTRWFSRAQLLTREEPYYTWSNGTKANFIPLSDPIAIQHLNTAETYQNEYLSRISDRLNGRIVLPAGEKGRILGFPVDIDEKEAELRTSENKKFQSAWKNLSKETRVIRARNIAQNNVDAFIMLDQVKSMCSLISGEWVFESMFYCVSNRSSSLDRFRDLLESSTTYADTSYLFAVEFKL